MIAALARQQTARLINLALDQNPAARERLASLGDLRLNIRVTQPRAILALRIHAGTIALEPANDEPADLELAGSAPALTRLVVDGTAPVPDTVTITGDPALLASLRTIQAELELDWESELATRVGDTPTRLLGSGLRIALHGGTEALSRGRELLINYLADELPATPPGPLHGIARAGAEAALAFSNWLGVGVTSGAPTSCASRPGHRR
jgi:ubiquinone biosynthesis protein UbiJ